MAERCKKCDPHEICEECPEWIFTMADLIMCMMGLFVLLWILKPSPTPPAHGKDPSAEKQETKLIEQVAAIREAFGYVPDPKSGDPVDDWMTQKSRPRLTPGQKGAATEDKPAAEGTDPEVTTIRESKMSAVGTRVLFERGEAKLDAGDAKNLDEIAAKIMGVRLIVIIKGHAARDDFDSGMPQDLMAISLKRAQLAADYLVKKGVAPDILRVQGCSIFEPVRQQAYTPAAQSQNRRVEVFSTDVIVRDLQDPRQTSMVPVE